MALDQQTRSLQLTTPLGDNELLLTTFQGEESLSRLFRFELEMISDNNAIAAKDIVGQNVTFSVKLTDDSPRFFNGFVSRFVAGGEDTNGRAGYRAEVMPWLWFCNLTSDCRIFQNKTAKDIIEQIFGDLGFSDFEFKLNGHHPEREYCVQYRETDFNFVSRLMEEEGIFYFFKHEDGKHTLVMADDKVHYFDCPENEVAFPPNAGDEAIEDHITGWEHRWEFRTGKFAQTDYNFETPTLDLMTNESSVIDMPGMSDYEQYDYPGLYGTKGDGRPLTQSRIEAEEAAHDIVEGGSLCKTFTPGGKFKLTEHPSESEVGQSYAITGISHHAQEAMAYETGSGGAASFDYRNWFSCIPSTVVYRPPLRTIKPVVQGHQTAIVVGPAGEEIYPDEFGRVKVQFPWDREGQMDENSSCWIRVSQVHAGKSFGGIDLPRIDEEVIVGFLEGDPDRPIIVGRVYHADNMPPFGLPDSKTISGLKSKSHKAEGYNELVMDDTAGKEELRMHAQFDMNTVVENDQTTTVHNNRTDQIDVDDSETVGNDQTGTVGNNQTLSVGANRSRTVGQNETVTVALTRTHTVGVNEAITVGAAQEVTVGAARAVTVGANQNVSIGNNRSSSIGKDDSLTVGKNLTIDAGDQITIKTGKAKIVMKKDGTIQIEGKDISIKGSGKITGKATKDMVLKAKKILQY